MKLLKLFLSERLSGICVPIFIALRSVVPEISSLVSEWYLARYIYMSSDPKIHQNSTMTSLICECVDSKERYYLIFRNSTYRPLSALTTG